MNRRRGISLIEMLVVIGTSSVIMFAGVGTLHLLMKSERTSTESLVQATNQSRLSSQFRADVHAATTATIGGQPGDAPELQLAVNDGGQISYAQQGRALLRTQTQPAQTTERDQYRLPADVRVQFAVTDAGAHQLAELNWQPLQQDEADTTSTSRAASRRPIPLKIEAVVGKDSRFQEATP